MRQLFPTPPNKVPIIRQPCGLVADVRGRIEGQGKLTGTKDNDVIFSSAQVSAGSQPASFTVTDFSFPYLCAIATVPPCGPGPVLRN